LLWLRKLLVQLALARPADMLVKASGGEARTVRGMTLEPRFQYLEAQARHRAAPRTQWTVEQIRAQTEMGAALFGGGRVPQVKTQKLYIPGRSYSVPARLYLPTVRDNRAAMLVYYHFGGGVVGSFATCNRLCALIARAAQAPVLSVEYRLAPEYRFPIGLEDGLHAYQWAVEHGSRYGAPPGKVGVGGDSMGGNFAAVIAQQTRNRHAPVMQLLIYPATDPTAETASMHEFADAFPLTSEMLEFFLENYLPPNTDLTDLRLSPGREQNLAGLAPALVYTAGFDMLLDQGEAYADRLAQAGVKVTRARFETLPHGFVSFPQAAPAAEQALRRIAKETAAALKKI
jgi:acetyl esterase/lipase